MTAHAVRLESAGASVTVVSPERAVIDWSARYFGPWWKAAEVPSEDVCAGAVVTAAVDTSQYDDVAFDVAQHPHTSTEYARARLLVARDVPTGTVRAVSPEQVLAYRSQPGTGRLDVFGCHAEGVATATARLAREMMRGQLLRDGWAVLHASAVVGENGRAVLTVGSKGAGKSTTALTLASSAGFRLLANDRVFVRPNDRRGVDVLPWPSAAALGLGLLKALGWFTEARKRLEAGESLHPTQADRVTEAIRAGDPTPLWEGDKEQKAQVFPDQFPDWFGVRLATEGEAAALVFPRIEAGVAPAVEERDRVLEAGDFMSGVTEDRYPDVFGLLGMDGGGAVGARREVARLLAKLPYHRVVLGHDLVANSRFLATGTRGGGVLFGGHATGGTWCSPQSLTTS
ncbi:hypothetical protein [Streptomyces sp. CRN 30]|uniref:hypothetical protein n=1 Tax=Streptomyces sp. CRN 30 TaxID=3075613 RepID=UPI002A835269|nr:hypothetical protein [Streptomyces sp. CRN 30]